MVLVIILKKQVLINKVKNTPNNFTYITNKIFS